jgi:hypothetical protein
MSRNQRLALVVAALAVAAIAFVIANPGGGDDGNSDSTEAVETAPERNAPDSTETAEAEPAPPPLERIAVAGGEVEGGVRTISVSKGDLVRIVIRADAPDELHLHGYDITRVAEPGKPARFRFKADLEGVFELESHTAEDAGLPPAVAKVVVEPS